MTSAGSDLELLFLLLMCERDIMSAVGSARTLVRLNGLRPFLSIIAKHRKVEALHLNCVLLSAEP